jgi:hypothetical protein
VGDITGGATAGPGPGGPPEDDHDLLTFGEVRTRLAEEVRAEQARLDALTAADPVDEPALARSRARLAALREGARRNTAQAINDENFERFFGYPGKARRNTERPTR